MEFTLRNIPSIFISATLTVKKSFEHYRNRIGLNSQQSVHECLVQSPFNYNQQVKLYIPSDLPPPNEPDFPDTAAQRTIELVNQSGGGAFVLCTSKKMLRFMGAALQASTP